MNEEYKHKYLKYKKIFEINLWWGGGCGGREAIFEFINKKGFYGCIQDFFGKRLNY